MWTINFPLVWFVLACLQFRALRFQEVRGRGGFRSIYKHDAPALFWIAFSMCLPFAALALQSRRSR
jgi:hypothetical protein